MDAEGGVNDIGEMLTLASKACKLEVSRVGSDYFGICLWVRDAGYSFGPFTNWAPHTCSQDTAEMCVTLEIDTVWRSGGVLCSFDDLDVDATEFWASHDNDRAAAWRMAALRVAAEIGRQLP